MLREVLKGTGWLIGGYLLLSWGTNAGTLFTKGATAGEGLITTLQGR
ncbi:MAG TPA: hypothetical protein VGL75_04475 [Acidothermaceae bacterium]|jgi:hypothetical protein